MLPPELAARVTDIEHQIDDFDTRLGALELVVNQITALAPLIHTLRNDFNSIRTVVQLLMREIDERGITP